MLFILIIIIVIVIYNVNYMHMINLYKKNCLKKTIMKIIIMANAYFRNTKNVFSL